VEISLKLCLCLCKLCKTGWVVGGWSFDLQLISTSAGRKRVWHARLNEEWRLTSVLNSSLRQYDRHVAILYIASKNNKMTC